MRATLIAAALAPVILWHVWSRYAPYPNVGGSLVVFDGGATSAQFDPVFDQVGWRRALRYFAIRASGDETHMTGSLGYGRRPVSDLGISIADSAIFVDGREYTPKIASGYLVWNPLAKRFEEVPDDLLHATFNGQQDVVKRDVCQKEVAPLVGRIARDIERARQARFGKEARERESALSKERLSE